MNIFPRTDVEFRKCIRDADMTSHQASTLLALADGYHRSTGEICISTARLAGLLKISDSQARRRIRDLVQSRILNPIAPNEGGRDRNGRGIANRYVLNLPMRPGCPSPSEGGEVEGQYRRGSAGVYPSKDTHNPSHPCAPTPAPMRATQGEEGKQTIKDALDDGCPAGWEKIDWHEAVAVAAAAGHRDASRFCERAGSLARVVWLKQHSRGVDNVAGLMEKNLQQGLKPDSKWVEKHRAFTKRRRGQTT